MPKNPIRLAFLLKSFIRPKKINSQNILPKTSLASPFQKTKPNSTMKIYQLLICGILSTGIIACNNAPKAEAQAKKEEVAKPVDNKIIGEDGKLYQSEQFADLRVLHYYIPQWEKLTPKQKELVYYLYEAGLAGRDMMWDQNCKVNLPVRHALESIYSNYKGDKTADNWLKLESFLKQMWAHTGIHHHYNSTKLTPEFTEAYLDEAAKASSTAISADVRKALFDPTYMAMKVESDATKDLIASSAVNFYEGVSQKEVEDFYNAMRIPGDRSPLEIGLNSKLVKENGIVVEKKWMVGGMYTEAIEKVVFWLEKASLVAENDKQAASLRKLIEYYKTGNLKTWADFNILWTQGTGGDIDFIQGYVETYNDPLGYRGSYESIVEIKDFDASARMKVMMDNAQWFEDNSSTAKEHKKDKVVGITYNIVNVVGESGDASPQTPIGVNLPNANWIRAKFGSKSVSLGNIEESYDKASGKGLLAEFVNDDEELKRAQEFGSLAGKLHTAMHEVIGHASGKINEGVDQPRATLKNYASTIEEGRADLVALYFIMDPKLVELGLMPSLEVGKAEYDGYIRSALLTQLRRIKEGKDIEEAHMRNRAWISNWLMEKAKADGSIVEETRDGKTYYDIKDYDKMRVNIGELLKEVQRITSEGDFNAAAALADNYGKKVNQALRQQVVDRAAKYNIAPFNAMVNPVLEAVKDANGVITDVKVSYPTSFAEQQLYYGKNYSFLPVH
jgi:dipeptidyl-peptidase III